MNPLTHVNDPVLQAALDEFVLSRRTFLGSGLALALLSRGRSTPALSGRPFATFVNLRGGNDALNTLIPTRLPLYSSLRRTIGIAPEAGASLAEGPYATTDYVLHPALASIARLYREGHVACVRLAGYPDTNQSHFLSQDIWSRGYRGPRPEESGWIARFKDLYAPEPTGVVAIGLGSQLDFRGGRTTSTHSPPNSGNSRSVNYRFTGDPRYPANEILRNSIVDRVLVAPRAHSATERARRAQVDAVEQAKRAVGGDGGGGGGGNLIQYPPTQLGSALRFSADLERVTFQASIYYANHGEFDTHAGQGGVEGRHADELRGLDEAVDAYARDLIQLGAWGRAAVVVFSEFGRRNAENGSGTDHGEGGVMLVIGGTVRGGMYGPDLTAQHLAGPVLPPLVDFRSVYEELLAGHLGVDPAPVFDEPYARTPLGLFA